MKRLLLNLKSGVIPCLIFIFSSLWPSYLFSKHVRLISPYYYFPKLLISSFVFNCPSQSVLYLLIRENKSPLFLNRVQAIINKNIADGSFSNILYINCFIIFYFFRLQLSIIFNSFYNHFF